jgi:hypothetical protein
MKAVSKALEHYELATTHLAVALHLFTEHWEELNGDQRLQVLAAQCSFFMTQVQPVLKGLCDEGVYQMPAEALSVLANTDPRTYLEAAERVRKERSDAEQS